MLVRDIISNDKFDFDANYTIYECKGDECWYEVEPVASTVRYGFGEASDSVLDMEIQYMTILNSVLIIEATRNQE